jgi:hypothetical protein
MKKIILAFAAAATLGLSALVPSSASARPLAMESNAVSVQLVQHRDHGRYDRYDRYDRRDDRRWRRHHAPREVCTVKRVRTMTPHGWRVRNVESCRMVRGR